MASQDRRLQENRYRQDDWSDHRRDRFGREDYRNDEGRRYRSERQDFQDNPNDYGRGRELTFREDYARNGDYLGRYPGDLSGRNHFDEEYFIDDSQFAGRDYADRQARARSQRLLQGPLQGRGPDNYGNRPYGLVIEKRFERDYVGRGRDFDDLERGYGQGYGQERGSWTRASDDISPWFDDDAVAHRRDLDTEHLNERFSGRGPKNYKRSDVRILEDIGDRLTDDPYVDASEIEVLVHDNEVTLNGIVSNRIQRRRAELIAESVSGVHHLQNNLRLRSHHKAHAQAGSHAGANDEPNAPASNAQKSSAPTAHK
ncbi:BON domain-containing protein [Beijerinckia indica]|uniref:Transport-associated n=1 Tax=Beijerinckia indica subsp. indica (strain ATCC 9039 / DSM 1715 / NCIMB 8712) TaxID=395963 RepID=B2ID01_BEII9|nr:BON domain-containing protein [Beijerinckia indica]ACB96766.1 transport-associated [Beijerinckia indica subsp. indica ATCC 9039]